VKIKSQISIYKSAKFPRFLKFKLKNELLILPSAIHPLQLFALHFPLLWSHFLPALHLKILHFPIRQLSCLQNRHQLHSAGNQAQRKNCGIIGIVERKCGGGQMGTKRRKNVVCDTHGEKVSFEGMSENMVGFGKY
jgi:hypothetical protein